MLNNGKNVFVLAALTCSLAISSSPKAKSAPKVELMRVPDSGLQPQTATDAKGTVHLVYFKGNPSAGDLYYARSADGKTFSSPIRVNSAPGSAVAVGNIRGARLATGRAGKVYVAWNGSQRAAQANHGRPPMLFTRLNPAGTAFEPERNVIQSAYGIDGGGGLAADRAGHVYVVWHAPSPGTKGESSRLVWVTRSDDDGRTFQPEHVAWTEPTGTCGCCSLNAFATPRGEVYVLFRSARETVHRDMYLLVSKDYARTFSGSDISPWNVGYCVMSSEAFVANSKHVFASWETEKQVHFGTATNSGVLLSQFVVSSAGSNEKYPALAANHYGDLLVTWTEGMGWKRGGSVHWAVLDNSGKRMAGEAAHDGVPAWSLVATYSRPDGSFVILY